MIYQITILLLTQFFMAGKNLKLRTYILTSIRSYPIQPYNKPYLKFLTQKISTKTAWFTTFPNSRQNSVNAFEIMQHRCFQHWYCQHWCCQHQCYQHWCYKHWCFQLWCFQHWCCMHRCCYFKYKDNVLQAPVLETHCQDQSLQCWQPRVL